MKTQTHNYNNHRHNDTHNSTGNKRRDDKSAEDDILALELQFNRDKSRNKKTQGTKTEKQGEENEDIFFINYFASREANSTPRIKTPSNNSQQIDAVSVSNDESGDESQDEATTAMLDEAATRYYESVATELGNEDDSDIESTLYDIGKDTQFAFESQKAEGETRKRRAERPPTKEETSNNNADDNGKLQFSIDKMDLYLFLTVFTAMSCLLYTSPSPRD